MCDEAVNDCLAALNVLILPSPKIPRGQNVLILSCCILLLQIVVFNFLNVAS